MATEGDFNDTINYEEEEEEKQQQTQHYDEDEENDYEDSDPDHYVDILNRSREGTTGYDDLVEYEERKEVPYGAPQMKGLREEELRKKKDL